VSGSARQVFEVESFAPEDARRRPRGTVAGPEGAMTVPPYCFTFTCGDSRIRPCLFG
jgi:hypothetical protein